MLGTYSNDIKEAFYKVSPAPSPAFESTEPRASCATYPANTLFPSPHSGNPHSPTPGHTTEA